MLKISTLQASMTLATQWSDKGLVATAKSNTALGELVGMSALPYQLPVESDSDIETVFQGLEAITKSNVEQNSQHDLQINALVDQLSRLVTTHVGFAKNVVKPLVVDFAKSVQDYLQTYKPKSASENFELKVFNAPELIYDESFLDTLKPYQGKTVLVPDLRFKLAFKTEEELLGMVVFGSERVDQLIIKWHSEQDENFLSRVYNSFFSSENTKDIITYQGIDKLTITDRMSYALAILLLSNKLMNNADGSDENINLQTHKATALQYMSYAGALLVDCINKYALMVKTNQLVIYSDQFKKLVAVNGLVYREWLNEGGSPEVILGYLISGDQRGSKEYINTKRDVYLKGWNSYISFYEVDQSNRFIDYFKDYLLSQFTLSLKEGVEAQEEYALKNPNYYTNVADSAKQYVNNLSKDQIQDVYAISLMLVAGVRFYYTPAFNILSDINEVAKVNPEVDVREAALLAVVNYISDYFASQITLVNE